MHGLYSDLRFTLRTFSRQPSFAVLAVVCTALGIGPNTLVFSLMNAAVLRSLAVAEPDRLVELYTTDEKSLLAGFSYYPTSLENYKDYRDDNRVFTELAAYRVLPMQLGGGDRPRRITGQIVSGNYFSALGVRPAVGRLLRPQDDQTLGGHPVAVLSYGLWSRVFAGDRSWVGRTVEIDGYPFTLVGVAPEGFRGLDVGLAPELWVPMAMRRQIIPVEDFYRQRRALYFDVVGRLAPGVTVEQAEAALQAIARRLEETYPRANEGRSVRLVPLQRARINPNFRGGVLLGLGVLATAVGLVLLVAGINLANLFLARALDRQRELAVRLSLGASRRRLVLQLLTEGLVLGLAGGALGALLALLGRRGLSTFRPPVPVPVDFEPPLDGRVLGFTFLISILAVLLFALLPALRSTRPELVPQLKESSGFSSRGLGGARWRNLLIAVQVALSVVCLVAAGLFVQSLRHAQTLDPGFEDRDLFAVSVDMALQGYDETRGEELFRRAVERVETVPGVTAAGFAATVPLRVGVLRSFRPVGREIQGSERGVLVGTNVVGRGYFEALRVPLVVGRKFDDGDREEGRPVAIVNQTLAERFWPGESPLGKRFRLYGDERSFAVVGVARDAKYISLSEEPRPYLYLPLAQSYQGALSLLVRTTDDPEAVMPAVERRLLELDPSLNLFDRLTVRDLVHQSVWAQRMGATLLGGLGLLALLLALVGLYGVMSYSLGQRRRELGIRSALGAAPRRLLAMVLARAMGVVAAGVAAGLLLGLAAGRLMGSLLSGTSTQDPQVYLGVAALFLLTALVAAYWPAQRAAASDPMIGLRRQ